MGPKSFDRITILCVDDDARTRKLLIQMLSKHNSHYVLKFADNGVDAMLTMREYQPDIYIVGLEMPHFDHVVTIKEIQKVGKASHSIGLSKRESLDTYDRFVQSGLEHHLSKPIKFEHLTSKLNDISKNVLMAKLITAGTS